MTKTSRSIALLGGVAVASLSFAACSGDNGGDAEAFCAKFEEFNNDADFGNNDEDLIAGIKELQGLAPGEIKDDLGTMVVAFDVLSDFTKKLEAGEEIDEEDAALVKASDDIDAAGQAVEDYVDANCGLES